MSESWLYFKLGYRHILDLQGYDHMLFLLVLCGVFTLSEWKSVLGLVTAFTLGHSLTLALTALDVIHIRPAVVEFLIPVTILLTAIGNLLWKRVNSQKNWMRFVLALCFGLVHGMGFSSYFQSLLGAANEVLKPLLFFNLGVEAGQCLIVMAILGLGWLALRLKLPAHWWRIGISLFGAAVAVGLIVGRIP